MTDGLHGPNGSDTMGFVDDDGVIGHILQFIVGQTDELGIGHHVDVGEAAHGTDRFDRVSVRQVIQLAVSLSDGIGNHFGRIQVKDMLIKTCQFSHQKGFAIACRADDHTFVIGLEFFQDIFFGFFADFLDADLFIQCKLPPSGKKNGRFL